MSLRHILDNRHAPSGLRLVLCWLLCGLLNPVYLFKYNDYLLKPLRFLAEENFLHAFILTYVTNISIVLAATIFVLINRKRNIRLWRLAGTALLSFYAIPYLRWVSGLLIDPLVCIRENITTESCLKMFVNLKLPGVFSAYKYYEHYFVTYFFYAVVAVLVFLACSRAGLITNARPKQKA